MKTEKAILRRLKAWANNPMLVSGTYKLFTYLPFEKIPAEYSKFFDEQAKNVWDSDLKDFTEEKMIPFVDNQLRLILDTLAKGNIINAIGLFPAVLADLWVFDYPIDKLIGSLNKEVNSYRETIKVNGILADEILMIYSFQLIREIQKTLVNYAPSYDVDKSEENIVSKFLEINSRSILGSQKINKLVDSALEEYKEKEANEDEKIQDNSLVA